MPRRPRSWLPDGFFHAGSKGTGGALVFADDVDREAFLGLLEQAARLFGVRLLAWCLMSTHYHVVVEATCKQLTAMMHRLNGLYAQRFNRRHGRKGHLFEERFWSWVIDDEDHLWAAVRYVLDNPTNAGLCVDWRDWAWSWARVAPRRGTVPRPWLEVTWPPGLRGRQQDDVHLAGPVDPDGELLLDVGATARARHDRERARQVTAERRE
jgi:REP element-mobilizing transposase RayT